MTEPSEYVLESLREGAGFTLSQTAGQPHRRSRRSHSVRKIRHRRVTGGLSTNSRAQRLSNLIASGQIHGADRTRVTHRQAHARKVHALRKPSKP